MTQNTHFHPNTKNLPSRFVTTDVGIYGTGPDGNRYWAIDEKAEQTRPSDRNRYDPFITEDIVQCAYKYAEDNEQEANNTITTSDPIAGTRSTRDEIITGVKAEANRLEKQSKYSDGEARFYTADELLQRKIESIPCLIEPIFQRVGLVAVAGSSDVGKSTFLRQLAFCVATGERAFLGWPIKSKHQSAIYVSSEDDDNATALLLNKLNQHFKKDYNECTSLRLLFYTHELLQNLDKELTRQPADLIVIDAFGDLYAGDANKTNQIRRFLHDYSQLAQKHECLVVWLHHTGKRTDEEAPSKHHVIGGQGFEGKMRLLIELRRDHQDKTIRHLCIVKGNYLSDEYKEASYVLRFENFFFQQTSERTPFEQLSKPKEETDIGLERYNQIQKARKEGLKGQELADYLGWSKGYISQIERKYGAKEKSDPEFTESLHN